MVRQPVSLWAILLVAFQRLVMGTCPSKLAGADSMNAGFTGFVRVCMANRPADPFHAPPTTGLRTVVVTDRGMQTGCFYPLSEWLQSLWNAREIPVSPTDNSILFGRASDQSIRVRWDVLRRVEQGVVLNSFSAMTGCD